MADFPTFESVREAIGWVAERRSRGARVGSLHTLGALHIGHGSAIGMMRAENDEAIVTIYPNRSQFAPGTVYRYDLAADIALAREHGATAIVAPSDEEMFPPAHRTFLDQGECYDRMDGTILPFLFRGMVTMSFRWVNALRPDTTYWGLKDIGQCVLVERALADFMVPVALRRVPCVRTRSGVPVSSRLRTLDCAGRADVGRLYRALEAGRKAAREAGVPREAVVAAMRSALAESPLERFTLRYIDCFDPGDFSHPQRVAPPLILHSAISCDGLNHFDGLLLETEEDLRDGPAMTWIDDDHFYAAAA